MISLLRMIIIGSIFAFSVLCFTDYNSMTLEERQIFDIFLAVLSTIIGMAFNILIKAYRLIKLTTE
jgi:hypothetical protein